MSQYSAGTVTVESGTQNVYGSWIGTLTSYEGPFQIGDPLSFASTAASGYVLAWNNGTGLLKFYVTSTQQPGIGEVVTSTGTLSGTLSIVSQEPAFVGNVDPGDYFIIGTPGVSYEVASVQTKGHFKIASSFAQASASDSSYIVSNSFTVNYGFAYAEAGDQKPAEVIKRGIVAIDAALLNLTSDTITVADSLTISGVPVSIGESGVSDHGALSGLADDDHTQYSLVDGTRPFTGVISGTGANFSSTVNAQLLHGDTVSGTNVNVTSTLSADTVLANTGTFAYGLTVSGVPVPLVGGSGSSEGRELLTANRTYYVRSDGDDSNDGLTDSSGGAFLTLQKAIDVVASLDLMVYDVTIQLGTGTFAGCTIDAPFLGGPGSSVSIVGDTGSASSYIISSAINVSKGGVIRLRGLDFTSSGHGISVEAFGSVIIDGAVIFGACTNNHMRVFGKSAQIEITSDYTIDGGCQAHFDNNFGLVICNGRTVTLTGTPAWSVAFAVAVDTGSIRAQGNTYSGSATGSRYFVDINGTINTNSGGANYFPGNSAGNTPTTGGQYI